MARLWCGLLIATVSSTGFSQRSTSARPSIIDVHFHATLSPGDVRTPQAVASRRATMVALDSLNVRYIVVNGVPDAIAVWSEEYPDRVIPGLLLPCENGLAANYGRPCYASGGVFPDTSWLRAELQAGRIKMLGEVTAEYLGIPPDDARLEPYFALAEMFDVPVAIHLGIGPPGAAYPSSPAPVKSPNFRAAAGRPLLLESVLLKHKRLRVSIMHAGWPLIDETIYMLYQHPQVYVDVAVLQYAIPPAAFVSAIKRLVEAGYADRVMVGSDGGVDELRAAIEVIEAADFLTADQKRGMLCGNAARFFKVDSTRACR